MYENDEHNYGPATLTCHSKNGINVNDEKLKKGDKLILTHNDVIKLSGHFELFKFCYERTPEVLQALPIKCTSKYHVGQQIGNGSFGSVTLLHNAKTSEKFAMKVIVRDTNPFVANRSHENILCEITIMKNITHARVTERNCGVLSRLIVYLFFIENRIGIYQ